MVRPFCHGLLTAQVSPVWVTVSAMTVTPWLGGSGGRQDPARASRILHDQIRTHPDLELVNRVMIYRIGDGWRIAWCVDCNAILASTESITAVQGDARRHRCVVR
jgi:hypothetical protein